LSARACSNHTCAVQSRCSALVPARLVAAAMLLWSATAAAQVNIESVRSQLDTSSFGARIRLSFAAYAGNTEGVIMGTSGIVGGRIGPNLGFATASADYARLGGTTSVK